MPLTDVLGPDDPFPGDQVGQPVTLSGTWLPDGDGLRLRPRARRRRRLLDGDPARCSRTAPRSPSCSAGSPTPDGAPAGRQGPARPGRLAPAVRGHRRHRRRPDRRRAAAAAHRRPGPAASTRTSTAAYAVARDGIAGLPAADLDAAARGRPVHRRRATCSTASSGGSSAASRSSSGGAGCATRRVRPRRRRPGPRRYRDRREAASSSATASSPTSSACCWPSARWWRCR